MGIPWRPGMATRCGSCSSRNLEYLADGTARCMACGRLSTPAWLTKDQRVAADAVEQADEGRRGAGEDLDTMVEWAQRRIEDGWKEGEIRNQLRSRNVSPAVVDSIYGASRESAARRVAYLWVRGQWTIRIGVLGVLGGLAWFAALFAYEGVGALASPFNIATLTYLNPVFYGGAGIVHGVMDRRDSRSLAGNLALLGTPVGPVHAKLRLRVSLHKGPGGKAK